MIKIDNGKVEFADINDLTDITQDKICDIVADITAGVLCTIDLLNMTGNSREKASEYVLAVIKAAIENEEEKR